ncbi:GNAT family N-acetyltransferase [Meridianimaribacter flavus]|jgi:hypothetical protein|uniref:Acetyltransferase (GNAT) family protein n=1 Tax=Meridianimaribacter flavus TaxID=571115 RepID=A0ABY2G796_9FLAO|nr:GNAT family N-acetyltransferase [Meridianimaribacter flavus]RYH74583.1 GNAT family N-acetyltransferase [Flavobacteriaceae bacterium 144Ye]TDY12399.1 acetyltransferase (GNAT) family protein [Meridianimaribacter flavus]
MKSNPFTSSTYSRIWSKHFNKKKPDVSFAFLDGVKFVKHSLLPLYINVGKNLTKGVGYEIDESANDYKGKTILIYDVPKYFSIPELKNYEKSTLRLKKVFQYFGYLMDISNYTTYEEYIKAQFNSKNRREFRSNIRKLEESFDIDYRFVYKSIDESEYEKIFNEFYKLLSLRYNEKGINLHILNTREWGFYKDLVYEMIQEKKALMLIISDRDTPIGITLNFLSENILFETITVFDPDYYKFSIGKTSIIKLLEWCFENNYVISDFSKGSFDYKQKWSNMKYEFNYHILYDKNSIKSRLLTKAIEYFFKLKLFLRNKNFSMFYRKVLFLFEGNSVKSNTKFTAVDLNFFEPNDSYVLVDINDDDYFFLKKFVCAFLFANPQHISKVLIYKNISENEYIIKGTDNVKKITILT